MILRDCDLCGSHSFRRFPQRITGPQSIVVCNQCGLMSTNPSPDEAEIDALYAAEFADDPGANLCAHLDAQQYQRLRDEQQQADAPILARMRAHLNPAGLRWLEVRFRLGAMLAALQTAGARVEGCDLFDRNVENAARSLGVSTLRKTGVFDMLAAVDGPLDAISMTTIHVLAHAPSPMKLLRDSYRLLKPGGYVFLLEKDVATTTRSASKLAISYPYGMAHYHHLTINTLRAFVETAGFEVRECGPSGRVTGNKHIFVAARKPLNGQAPNISAPVRADDPDKIFRRMNWLYWELKARGLVLGVYRPMKRAIKGRLPGSKEQRAA